MEFSMICLITFIVIFAIFLCFSIFNLDNKSIISFGFYKTVHEIPVFITAFSSFVLGMLFTLPFMFTQRKGRKKPSGAAAPEASDTPDGKKKRWGQKGKNPPRQSSGKPKRKNEPNDIDAAADGINKDDSPYGID